MTAQKLIKEYGLYPEKRVDSDGWRATGRIGTRKADAVERDNALPVIKENKLEIINILTAEWEQEKKEAAERKRRIKAIEGLEEIRAAKYEIERWHSDFNEWFECENDVTFRSKPKHNIKSLYAKYPRAAAYLQAEGYYLSSNYAKSSAGEKALEKIINGEDYTQAIAEMQHEWREHTTRHMWD